MMCNPFENTLIVEVLFKFFDFPDILSFRGVSKSWNRVALAFLRKRGVLFHLSNHQSKGKEDQALMIQFITANGLRNVGLSLSLVTPRPWAHCIWTTLDWWSDDDEADDVPLSPDPCPKLIQDVSDFYDSALNDPGLAFQVTTVLLCPSWLTQLSLEMTLKDEGDVALFNTLMAQVPRLARFAVDFYTQKDALAQALGRPDESLFLPALETFSPRISFFVLPTTPEDPGDGDRFVSEASWKHLLGLFPSTKYLDLEGWATGVTYSHFMESSCDLALKALQSLHTEGRLPALTGLRMPRRAVGWFGSTLTATLQSLTLPLTELYLRNEDDKGKLLLPLGNLGRSLETLDVHLRTWAGNWEWDRSLTLPHLPRLKAFIGSSQSAWNVEVESHDAFGFVSLFQSDPRQLETRLPALSSLTLFYTPFEAWEGLWESMFRETGHTYPQIQKLCLSLVAECDHPTLDRILRTFPSLTVLRHMQKLEGDGEDLIGMCQHSWDPSSPTRGEETVDLVPKGKDRVNCEERIVWEGILGSGGVGEWSRRVDVPLAVTDPFVFDPVMTPTHAHYFWKGPCQSAFI